MGEGPPAPSVAGEADAAVRGASGALPPLPAGPRATIVAIEKAHVSGRHAGGGPPAVLPRAPEADPARRDDRLAHLSRTDGGKVLKSTATCCRD